MEYKKLGLCRGHYSVHRAKTPKREKCSTPDCGRGVFAVKRGLCRRCYFHRRAEGTLEGVARPSCSVSSCPFPLSVKGYCIGHYHQVRKYGKVTSEVLKTKIMRKNKGFFMTQNGYRKVRASDGRWILEHRFVLEKKLGRPLFPDESVHHRNGDKLDNRPKNLELWVRPQPTGVSVKDAVKWAREILRRYA